MEAPKSPEVTMANSSAIVVAELTRARAHVRSLAEELEALVAGPIHVPNLLHRINSLAVLARKFLEE